jgi:6-phosphogluconolactonase
MNDAKGRIEVSADATALAEHAAAVIRDELDQRLSAGADHVTFVATGGSTPIATYEALRGEPWRGSWAKVRITLSDERWVPPTSPDSNERMLRRHLLGGPASAATFTPLWGPEPTPQDGAARAEAAIARLMPFDVVLLGMGDDGHFGSLFPGNPVLAEGLDPNGEKFCIGVPAGAPAPPQPRISLTLRAFLASRQIILLVTGETKRRRIEEARAGADLPVRALLLQEHTPVRILWAP